MSNEPKDSLADDLLKGAPAISRFLGWKPWEVYYHAPNLPITRVGATLFARKSELEKRLSGKTEAAA
jgi:hypothetical protein